ncbi:MAG: GntR family transcriptional regulator [Peptococcaceae bacterium]|nr:GntR family transcriptional regulator [Peptococcaceae bacterium]
MELLDVIIKKNLSEQIYEAVKADILTQKIGFGQKLINRELQKRFGVSSTPVRDAINRLYLDGLLEDISNGGARIISFDLKMALEVNEIVALLNQDAVALTVTKGNQDKVTRQLSQIIAKQQDYLDHPKYLEYDKQFHHTFFEFSDNARLIKVYDEHSALWDMLILIYHKNSNSSRETAFAQHQQIFSAYRGGDYAAARRLLSSHFTDAVEPLKKKFGAQEGSVQECPGNTRSW